MPDHLPHDRPDPVPPDEGIECPDLDAWEQRLLDDLLRPRAEQPRPAKADRPVTAALVRQVR